MLYLRERPGWREGGDEGGMVRREGREGAGRARGTAGEGGLGGSGPAKETGGRIRREGREGDGGALGEERRAERTQPACQVHMHRGKCSCTRSIRGGLPESPALTYMNRSRSLAFSKYI